ncbi:MAG: transketolase-like TK C-terminal-containing protein, partial [Actinomycetes bacterium]
GERPTGLALTRQSVPVLEGTDADGVAHGGYVLTDTSADLGGGLPDVLLIATGSEVQFAVVAQETLAGEGIKARVVSMPCVEWFDAQDQAYRDQVLPPTVKARVAVEAGIAMPWYRFVGEHGEVVSLEHFGASADWQTLYREFGFTGESVADAARRSLDRSRRTHSTA